MSLLIYSVVLFTVNIQAHDIRDQCFRQNTRNTFVICWSLMKKNCTQSESSPAHRMCDQWFICAAKSQRQSNRTSQIMIEVIQGYICCSYSKHTLHWTRAWHNHNHMKKLTSCFHIVAQWRSKRGPWGPRALGGTFGAAAICLLKINFWREFKRSTFSFYFF